MSTPKTAEEFLALPIGGGFGEHTHTVTDEERAAGFAVVFGALMNITPKTAAKVKIPIAPDVRSVWVEENDPFAVADADGVWWRLGKDSAGNLFRVRAR